MECPICFNLIVNSCVGSCMHHYCYVCMIKWLSFNSFCPTCKKPILELKLDREFDNINMSDDVSQVNFTLEEVTKKIIIKFEDNIPPGITITNNTSGPGIKIVKLNNNDKCYLSGLRKGDIILFMNRVPCHRHDHCMKIIEDSYISKTELICELLIIKK